MLFAIFPPTQVTTNLPRYGSSMSWEADYNLHLPPESRMRIGRLSISVDVQNECVRAKRVNSRPHRQLITHLLADLAFQRYTMPTHYREHNYLSYSSLFTIRLAAKNCSQY